MMSCNEDRVVQLEAISYPAHERISVYMKSKPSPAMKQTEALFAQILVHSIHCSSLFPFELPASTSVDGKHIPLLGSASHLVCIYIYIHGRSPLIYGITGIIYSARLSGGAGCKRLVSTWLPGLVGPKIQKPV